MSSHSENGGNTGIDPKVARITRFDPMQKNDFLITVCVPP